MEEKMKKQKTFEGNNADIMAIDFANLNLDKRAGDLNAGR